VLWYFPGHKAPLCAPGEVLTPEELLARAEERRAQEATNPNPHPNPDPKPHHRSKKKQQERRRRLVKLQRRRRRRKARKARKARLLSCHHSRTKVRRDNALRRL